MKWPDLFKNGIELLVENQVDLDVTKIHQYIYNYFIIKSEIKKVQVLNPSD